MYKKKKKKVIFAQNQMPVGITQLKRERKVRLP